MLVLSKQSACHIQELVLILQRVGTENVFTPQRVRMKDVPQLNLDWMDILLSSRDYFPRCSLSKTSHCPQWCRIETPNPGFLTSPAGLSHPKLLCSQQNYIQDFSPQSYLIPSGIVLRFLTLEFLHPQQSRIFEISFPS